MRTYFVQGVVALTLLPGSTSRLLQEELCVPTEESGDCKTYGCCDLLAVCSEDGSCALAEIACTSDSCDAGEVCAAGASCVSESQVAITADTDPTSTTLGTVTFEGKVITLVGDKDEDGGAVHVEETTVYSRELDTDIHVIIDPVTGLPDAAYAEGEDELLEFKYDDNERVIEITEDERGSRRLGTSKSRQAAIFEQGTMARRELNDECTSLCNVIDTELATPILASCTQEICENATGIALLLCVILDALCTTIRALVVAQNNCISNCDCPGVAADPHMVGVRGQHIDWAGEDKGWYALVHDGPQAQIAVRLTAPLSTEFPDRQLITGVSVLSWGGHSLVIEAKDPYTTKTEGCPTSSPCIGDGSLRILVDGQESTAFVSPGDDIQLHGGMEISAVNLPAECRPFGADILWGQIFEAMARRQLSSVNELGLIDWARKWTSKTAAPSWCNKFLDEEGLDGVLAHQSNHAVFRIKTPHFSLRLHHGINHQGGEVIPDGRILPDLNFWQMDLDLESANVNLATVTGILGETARHVFDADGSPIMSGLEALGASVEDFRLSGPLSTDFAQVQKRVGH